METKWTPGPWTVGTVRNGFARAVEGVAGEICYGDILFANAHLIAAAPDGFQAAHEAYLAILRSPLNAWRIEQGLDGCLAGLRDYIAKATNRDPEEVQNKYEALARGES